MISTGLIFPIRKLTDVVTCFLFSGLILSNDCDSDELKSCFKQMQQSKDVVWIESIRSAVTNNLKELASREEHLMSRLAGKQ